jgi:iron complex outermembrane receptor protein
VLDDVPVTFADGQSNLEMIDLQDLSYVELLKGPGSSLYGNASGGVLLLYSNPLPQDNFLSSVSSTMGSKGLNRLNAFVGGGNERTHVSGSFANFHYDGFRNHASADFNRAIFKLASNLSKHDILQINAGYVKFKALNPGSLTKEQAKDSSWFANPSSVSNAAGQDGNQEQLAAIWKHQLDSNSLFRMNLYGIHRSVVNPIIGKIVVLPQNSGGMYAIYSSKINIMGKDFDWSAGAETALRLNSRKNFTNNKGIEGTLNLNQDEQIIGTGIFMQALAPIASNIDIDGSIRYDQTYFGVTDKLVSTSNTNNSGSRSMNGLNPSLGLVYRLGKNLNFFTNVSTSFETPTSTELANRPDGVGGFNPDLNPSHALEFEGGIRGIINPIVKYDITGYIINTKDELIPFQVPSAPGQDYYRNSGSTKRLGGEASIRYLPFTFLDANAGLTYIDASYKNFIVKGTDYSGNKIPGITPIRGVIELKLHSLKGFYCSTLMQSFGKVYADDANTATAEKYTVFDLGIGHEGLSFGSSWISKLIISGGISNILDTHYIASVTVNAAAKKYYEPAPGRSFYINARLEFGKR